MKQLIERNKIFLLLIVIVTIFSCEKNVEVELPKLVASFTHTINEETGAVSFINLSENADTYSWDFGDGISSTEINPIRSFPTGTYTIVLTARNAAGASETFEDVIVINIPLPINFPLTFDDPNVNYEFTTFNGAAFEIVDNPDQSGSNPDNSKVGSITNSGAAFEGLFFDVGMEVDLSTLKSVKANFWSDTPLNVLLKLEVGTGADVETTASHMGTGWEEIRFDLASAEKYSRVTLFVDGPGTTAGTFFIDDIEQTETPAPSGPQTAAPAPPTRDAANVASLYSDVYTSITVNEWSTEWDDADIEDALAAEDNIKKVTFGDNGGFLGVDFSPNAFDATSFTHFHMDYWIADEITSGQVLNPKWSNHENGAEVNAFEYTNAVAESGQWVSVDIPVGDFAGDLTRNNLAQFILATGNSLDEVFIDNIYFYKDGGTTGNAPTTAAPTPPTRDAADVASLYSDVYPSLTVSEWSTGWDDADNEETTAAGDNIRKVNFGDNGGFLGVDFSSNSFDATSFTHFHMDYWITDEVVAGQVLNPKWSNHENGAEVNAFEYTNATNTSRQWVSLDIPIADFGGDVTRNNLAQFILATGNTLDEVYIDNIYFYKDGGTGGTAPSTAAPMPPALDPANVISLYSDVFTNVMVSEWSTGWDDADNEETMAAGDNIRKVNFGSAGGFLGVDFSPNAFDATSLTHFHMDYWITDEVAVGQILNPKWSNHENGAEVNAFEYTNPTSTSRQWVSLDIPITDFGGDVTRNNLAQFILATANTLGEVYIDNIYFYKDGTIGGNEPNTAAPMPPNRDQADVISLYSDVYTSVGVSEWSTGWDDADITDTTAAGDNIKKINFGDNGGFLGVDFSANAFDASTLTHFHMDFWITDEVAAGQILNPKWSNHENGAEINAFEYTNPTSASKQWVSLDIPITDFGGDMTRNNLAQFILATANTLDLVYVDNIYLYKEGSSQSGCTGTVVPIPSLPADFEACESFTSTFANDGSITTSLAMNPSQAGNASENVLQIVKAAGTNRWAGFQNVFDNSLDITMTFKLKVYSSKPGAVFKFEVNNEPQDPGSGNPAPVYITIESANTWTDVEVQFINIPPNNTGVNQFVIKPDNPEGTDGELTDSEETYYIDDLRLE